MRYDFLYHLCLLQFLFIFHLIRCNKSFHPLHRPRTAQRHMINLTYHIPYRLVAALIDISINQMQKAFRLIGILPLEHFLHDILF